MMGIGYWEAGHWMLARPPEADKPLAGWFLDTGCWILDELKRLELKVQS